jgi:ABC-type Mn2+/Zn2+ transport system ATPase subunit
MGGHLRSSLMGGTGDDRSVAPSHQDFLMDKALCRSMFNKLDFETQLVELHKRIKSLLTDFEVHIRDGSYTAVHTQAASAKSRHGQGNSAHGGDGGDAENEAPHRAKQKIPTVMSANPCYKLYRLLKKCVVYRGKIPVIREEKKIMDKVNLVFESGKMYLVLGAPGSGKSTLLKYIANTHVADKNHLLGGTVKIGGVQPAKNVYWSKLVAYIDQIDRLDAYLTVYETCEFAWRCRSGGTHRKVYSSHDPDAEEAIALMDEQMFMVNKVIDVLGLTRVKDTFVGDQVSVRGISGGEKKRVTCAEMFCVGCPVLCCDEISTGLDGTSETRTTKPPDGPHCHHFRAHPDVVFSRSTLRSRHYLRHHSKDGVRDQNGVLGPDRVVAAAAAGDGRQL